MTVANFQIVSKNESQFKVRCSWRQWLSRFHFHFSCFRLCEASMFKTLNGILTLVTFITFFKALHVSASIGHPQVLKLFFKRTAVIFRVSCLSSLYLLCALFLVVCLRAYDCLVYFFIIRVLYNIYYTLINALYNIMGSHDCDPVYPYWWIDTFLRNTLSPSSDLSSELKDEDWCMIFR
jgi:hypothetical protein